MRSSVSGSTLLFFLLLFWVFSACRQADDWVRPDVRHISIDTEIRRFEQDLFALDTFQLAGLDRLYTEYGAFSEVFFTHILGVDDPRIAPEGREAYVRGFITHPEVLQLYDTTQLVYPDLRREKALLDKAFAYLQYYFPEREVPRITTFISEFSIASFIFGEDELAAGLDLFLGEGYPYTYIDPTNPVFSAYLTRTYNRDHLPVRLLKPLLEDIIGPPSGDQLMDHMVRNGKILAMLDFLLPAVADTAIFEVTPTQMTWLRENEWNIWSYFLSEELLYSNDWKRIRKYVEYSPHSPGMPEEAPGRTANWIGYRIARTWLMQQPENDLRALANLRDTQALLDAARYKPSR
jgi:hypothetical protein